MFRTMLYLAFINGAYRRSHFRIIRDMIFGGLELEQSRVLTLTTRESFKSKLIGTEWDDWGRRVLGFQKRFFPLNPSSKK